jgi:hypothetical protein
MTRTDKLRNRILKNLEKLGKAMDKEEGSAPKGEVGLSRFTEAAIVTAMEMRQRVEEIERLILSDLISLEKKMIMD